MAFGGLPPIDLAELKSEDAENDLEKLFLQTTEAGVKIWR